MERKKEVPLMLVENQGYIHYNKGSLVMYALQDYIGESTVNQALSNYIKDVGFQEPPYTVSRELIEHFRQATPSELQGIIEDLFETITLFDLTNTFFEGTGKYNAHAAYGHSKEKRNDCGSKMLRWSGCRS